MHLDIFHDPAFELTNQSLIISDLKVVPGRLGQLGLFNVSGINTTSVSLERIGDAVKLVPAKPRGADGTPIRSPKRSMFSINASHLPQRGYVSADEVQNLKAFGSMSELETVQNVVNREYRIGKRNNEVTIEWQRMGALKGQILDADGVTVLADLNQVFGLSMQAHDMNLDNAGTNVRMVLVAVSRKIEDALEGVPFSGVRVLCSPEFFDAIAGHPRVEDAFNRPRDGAFLREDQHTVGFQFGNFYFEEYRATVGGHRFIPAGKAYAVPTGVEDMFVTHYAPANYMDTVNTIGLPYYSKKAADKFDKGVEFEIQSNPLMFNTRLNAIVELSIT